MKKINHFLKSFKARQKGFTLIEILVVIGIIAVLAAIVIIAINPAKQFAQARITQRQSNVQTILNAIGQRIADNKGVFEGTFTVNSVDYHCDKLPTSAEHITTVDGTNALGNESGDLGCLVPTYVSALPVDPTWSSGTDTLYSVVVNTTGRVTVCSTAAVEAAVPGATQTCVTR